MFAAVGFKAKVVTLSAPLGDMVCVFSALDFHCGGRHRLLVTLLHVSSFCVFRTCGGMGLLVSSGDKHIHLVQWPIAASKAALPGSLIRRRVHQL